MKMYHKNMLSKENSWWCWCDLRCMLTTFSEMYHIYSIKVEFRNINQFLRCKFCFEKEFPNFVIIFLCKGCGVILFKY